MSVNSNVLFIEFTEELAPNANIFVIIVNVKINFSKYNPKLSFLEAPRP